MLVNQTTGEILAQRVVMCDSFGKKLRGLMFRRALDPDQAYVFVGHRESIAEAAIHMFFVFFPIAVFWLDGQKRMVSMALAKPFRPYYAPSQAARYYVECSPELLGRAHIGDQLDFE